MLLRMLNTHPDLYVLNESHWIPKMFEFYGTGRGSTNVLIEIVRRTWHVTGVPVYPADLSDLDELHTFGTEQTVAEFADALMAKLARAQRKRVWADKTPDYGGYMPILQTLWPKLRFVHLIRHGAPVAASMARHPGFKWMVAAAETWWPPGSYNRYFEQVPFGRPSIDDCARLWERRVRRIRHDAGRLRPGTYYEVRFEELIEDPAGSLADICSFVGLTSASEWLAEAAAVLDARRPRDANSQWEAPSLPSSATALLEELGYERGGEPGSAR